MRDYTALCEDGTQIRYISDLSDADITTFIAASERGALVLSGVDFVPAVERLKIEQTARKLGLSTKRE